MVDFGIPRRRLSSLTLRLFVSALNSHRISIALRTAATSCLPTPRPLPFIIAEHPFKPKAPVHLLRLAAGVKG